MALMIFSDPKHVGLIWAGIKDHTTRLPRKRPIKEGELLHCYYRSRMKKTCANCVNQDCEFSVIGGEDFIPGTKCSNHTSYIGVATVDRIRKGIQFQNFTEEEKEKWAIRDGFKDFADANEWFVKNHGKDWQAVPLEIIEFEGRWMCKPWPTTCLPCKYYSAPHADKGEMNERFKGEHTCGLAGTRIGNISVCPLKIAMNSKLIAEA
jgi:hypothetical protein